jgi:hypothetical protein
MHIDFLEKEKSDEGMTLTTHTPASTEVKNE